MTDPRPSVQSDSRAPERRRPRSAIQEDPSRREGSPAEAWNAIAIGYDRTNTPTQMAIAEEGLRRAGLRRGTRFLDVAAGSGASRSRPRGAGPESWRPTAGGTFQLTDGVHIVGELFLRSLAHWLPEAGVLLFEGRTPETESALWITDGTVGGTTPLLEGFSQIHHVVGSEREAYFLGATEEDGVARGRLWRTDGSPAGTRALDLDLANEGFLEYEMLDDVLLVVVGGIEPPTAALWRIAPGRSPLLLSDELLAPDGERTWRVETSVDLGRRKVLTVLAGYSDTLPTGGPVDVERWSTDGTVAGTLRIDESEHFPVPRAEDGSAFAHFGSWTYFAGSGEGAGMEVWRSNGLPDGTERLTDLCPGPCDGVDRYKMSRVGSFLVVNGNDGQHGWEPWIVPTDPTESPWMVGDLCPGLCGGGPVWAERAGRSVVLAVQGIATGSLLTFESDLTPEGTRILRHVHLDDHLGPDRALLGNRLVLPVGELFEVDPWVIEGEAPLCDSASGAACLQEERVEVSVRWSLSNGSSGEGQSVPMTDLAAYFWFFRPTNVELVAKLLDGCAVNGHRWLFVSGLTDVGVEIELRDLETGELERYENPVGRPFDAILDIEALSCEGVDH